MIAQSSLRVRFVKHCARAMVVAGLAAGGIVAVSGPAGATSCVGYQPTDSSWSVKCSGSAPDAFQAAALCTDNKLHFGAWQFQGSGNWSTANCGTNKFVTYGTYFTNS